MLEVLNLGKLPEMIFLKLQNDGDMISKSLACQAIIMAIVGLFLSLYYKIHQFIPNILNLV